MGVLGTGGIGRQFAEKMSGLVREIICFDKFPNNEWIKKLPNGRYAKDENELFASAHIISIHVPLLPETKHLINQENIEKMKDGVLIVNTSRGEIIATHDLVEAIKSGKVGGAALDVFEVEKDFIEYQDNVIISGLVAFYTDESIHEIASKTIKNLEGFLA